MLRDNLLALNQSDRQDNSVLTVSFSCSNDLEEQYPVESSANRMIVIDLVQRVDHLCKLEKVTGLAQIPGEPRNLLFVTKTYC